MADVEFKDYSIEVKEVIAELAYRALEESAGELESQVKDLTAVDEGNLKGSWSHRITGSVMANEYKAEIGSPLENAIWEEFGTGEYALNGDGRKGGWSYKDDKWGVWWHTMGKHPRRPLHKAYTTSKNRLIKHMQDIFKGGLS